MLWLTHAAAVTQGRSGSAPQASTRPWNANEIAMTSISQPTAFRGSRTATNAPTSA